jgi:hypothetical protein
MKPEIWELETENFPSLAAAESFARLMKTDPDQAWSGTLSTLGSGGWLG